MTFEVFKPLDLEALLGPFFCSLLLLLLVSLSHLPFICVWHILTFNWHLMVPCILVYILDCASRMILILSSSDPLLDVIYSSSLLCNWTSSDPLLVLFEALEHMWCFKHFFRPQLPLQLAQIADLVREKKWPKPATLEQWKSQLQVAQKTTSKFQNHI